MNSEIGIIVSIVFLFLVTFLTFPVRAAEDTTEVTVQVTVSQILIVDISPKLFTFSGFPGRVADPTDPSITQDTSSVYSKGYYFTVTNLGSVNITSIKVRADLPTSNPWGQGNPALHQIGDFVLLSNDTTAGSVKYYYVAQRLWSTVPPFYVMPPFRHCPSPSSWDESECKFFILRTAFTKYDDGEDWYIFIKKGANYTDGTVYVANEPRTSTQSGTTDFSSIEPTSLISNGNYGYAYLKLSSDPNRIYSLEGYLIVNTTANEVYFAYWDVDKASLASASGVYLWNQNLAPGASKDFRMQVRIPFGVPAGTISGKVYIIAIGSITG